MDGLRALAVMGVASAHWYHTYPLGFPAGSGVLLFFVISGFLITGILMDCWTQGESSTTRSFAIRNFYIRRILRIFPIYYLVLAGALVLNVENVRNSIFWHLSYTTNFYLFAKNEWVRWISHFWSLAVEEQFYLIWPACVFFIPRRLLWKVVILLIVAAPLFRILIATLYPDHRMVDILPISCFDSLGIGALLACAMRAKNGCQLASRLSRIMLMVGVPGFLITFYCFRNNIIPNLTGEIFQTFLVMFYGWLVYGTVNGFQGIGKILELPPMVYLGRISYGIYIFHYLAPWFIWWLLAHLHFSESEAIGILKNRLFYMGSLVILTLAASTLSWFLIESPINKYKQYFPYKKKSFAI